MRGGTGEGEREGEGGWNPDGCMAWWHTGKWAVSALLQHQAVEM